MEVIHLDFETRASADLESVGSYRYAEDPGTSILIAGVSRRGEEPLMWDVRQDPRESPAIDLLAKAIRDEWEIHAWNYQFEYAILYYVATRQLGLPAPSLSQMRCTQAVARTAGCSNSLGKTADFLNLDVKKNKLGKTLIRKFSIPQKDGSFTDIRSTDTFTLGGKRVSVSEAFDIFVDYCKDDVITEMLAAQALSSFELKGQALESFLMDARVNNRGVPADVDALTHADAIVKEHERRLTHRFREITGLGVNQKQSALKWMRGEGYGGTSLDKETRAAWQDSEDLSSVGRAALDTLAELSYAAVQKVPALLRMTMSDGVARGSFKWYGASRTGRWTSEGFQAQNMKKPPKWFRRHIPSAYQDLTDKLDIDTFELFHGNPYEAIASMSRYFIRFKDGTKILDVDFSSVEARILPMLIGADRILNKFRNNEPIYDAVGMRLGFDRDTGKTITLATQFQGGWTAVFNATKGKLTEEECRQAVLVVREENPEFQPAWKKFHNCWVNAMKSPEHWHEATKYISMGYTTKGAFPRMMVRLPSGRKLCYPKPRITPKTQVKVNGKWHSRDGHLDLSTVEGFHTYDLVFYGEYKKGLWGDVHIYGGKLLQNCTQAVGVDLLTYGCLQAEKAGYEPFFVVHDQVLAPATKSLEGLLEKVTQVPDWFKGFPLDASGEVVDSYCKS